MTGEEREVERRSKNWCGKEKRGLAEPQKKINIAASKLPVAPRWQVQKTQVPSFCSTPGKSITHTSYKIVAVQVMNIARNETALESGFFFFWENWKRLHIRMALVETSFSRKINITHRETSQDTCFLPPILVRLIFWWQESLPTKMFHE